MVLKHQRRGETGFAGGFGVGFGVLSLFVLAAGGLTVEFEFDAEPVFEFALAAVFDAVFLLEFAVSGWLKSTRFAPA